MITDMQTTNGWKSHQIAVPGSVIPMYTTSRTNFAPPATSMDHTQHQSPPKHLRHIEGTSNHSANPPHAKHDQTKFESFEASVSDAWSVDDFGINSSAAKSSADVVIRHHAAGFGFPSQHPHSSRHARTQAMQRLATQKEPLPSGSSSPPTSTQHAPLSLYPKLPEFPLEVTASRGNIVDIVTAEEGKFRRIEKILQSRNIDLDELKKECWKGIPHKLRPTAWRYLSGYLPPNSSRMELALKQKRDEYFNFVEQYFHTRHEDQQHKDTFRQIHIDIPRMCPLIPLFQQKVVQEMFERILYIWAIRHPASGYVQGINDLVTPFFVVFLSEHIDSNKEVGCFDLASLDRSAREAVEADSFGCFSLLLDTIQTNYTFAQPGIQEKVRVLQSLVDRVDNALQQHLTKNQVEYLQFAYRWMNNLLMREIPLRATIRLWDTYLSENNGFADFHVYVCAAFLRMWSRQVRQQKDFQSVLILLQNLPTQQWGDQQILELTADAYILMSTFAGSKKHLQTN